MNCFSVFSQQHKPHSRQASKPSYNRFAIVAIATHSKPNKLPRLTDLHHVGIDANRNRAHFGHSGGQQGLVLGKTHGAVDVDLEVGFVDGARVISSLVGVSLFSLQATWRRYAEQQAQDHMGEGCFFSKFETKR